MTSLLQRFGTANSSLHRQLDVPSVHCLCPRISVCVSPSLSLCTRSSVLTMKRTHAKASHLAAVKARDSMCVCVCVSACMSVCLCVCARARCATVLRRAGCNCRNKQTKFGEAGVRNQSAAITRGRACVVFVCHTRGTAGRLSSRAYTTTVRLGLYTVKLHGRLFMGGPEKNSLAPLLRL